MITQEKKQTIKSVIAISILVLIVILVAIMMIKYEVEGETNMPYKLSKIIVVGTATGVENKSEEEKDDTNWDLNIYQTNDVHFYIDENKDVKKSEDLLIKSVKIDNIQITKAPQKGHIKTYMPNSEGGRLFKYEEQFLINEKLEYKGAAQSSSTNLQIGSKGGSAEICFCNTDIANYFSDKKEDIEHDGTWLKKLEISNEEISFSVSFDFTIETTESKYKANIELDLPTSELGEEKNCYLEITDMSNIIFKRVK